MIFFPAHYYEKPVEQYLNETSNQGLLDKPRRLSQGNEKKLSKYSVHEDDLKPAQKSIL
jgi:hypothetical protein